MTGQRIASGCKPATVLRGEFDRRCRKEESSIAASVCGTAFSQLIGSLVAPSKPTDKSVDEIMKLVKDHLKPQP